VDSIFGKGTQERKSNRYMSHAKFRQSKTQFSMEFINRTS
jgi:hypothetical protein